LRRDALSILACPNCRGALEAAAAAEGEDEVEEGCLECAGCAASYPIRNGIPRFVEVDAYVDTFSFEWNRFHDVQLDVLNDTDQSEKEFRAKTGWSPEDFKGKLVLDVGVGAGRFSEIASRWGAQVVGVDLSFAVDAARKNIGGRKGVHVVQADLFRLPFRPGTFDLAFSMGVLHHTPDTREAFRCIPPFLKTGGELAVFIYGAGPYSYFSDIWRKVTARIPYRFVYGLSWLSVPLYYLYKIPVVGLAGRILFPVNLHPNARWRWLNTFDWYSPTYQHKHTWAEVFRWFEENGFADVKLMEESRETHVNINMKGRKSADVGGGPVRGEGGATRP
jgi:SAM-dependent methyltransferase